MEKDEIRKAIKTKRLAKKVTIAEVAKAVGRNPDVRRSGVYKGRISCRPKKPKRWVISWDWMRN